MTEKTNFAGMADSTTKTEEVKAAEDKKEAEKARVLADAEAEKAADKAAKVAKEKAAKGLETLKRREELEKEAVVAAEKLKVDNAREKEECLAKAQAILKVHDGIESNIGIGHEYWGLMNRFRAL